MYIDNSLLNLLISQLTIEYNGCHAPHRETPLYGRAAYWRVYYKDTYLNKITTPVKSLNPKPETLKKLFKKELQKRIEAIHERCTADHYGQIHLEQRDPYSIRPMLELILVGKYPHFDFKKGA